MDFITSFPKSNGFSKYATFMPSLACCTTKEAAQLFFKNVVKYWGLPRYILNDQDPRFIGNFWDELFEIFGTRLHLSTIFHPQNDGQTERVNALLECYLRQYVSAHQKDWAKLLDMAQFSYNSERSESTGRTPF